MAFENKTGKIGTRQATVEESAHFVLISLEMVERVRVKERVRVTERERDRQTDRDRVRQSETERDRE